MTSMIEKPRSNRAKSRMYEGQDHGTRGTDRRRIAAKKMKAALKYKLDQVKPDMSIEDEDLREDLYEFDRSVVREDAELQVEEIRKRARTHRDNPVDQTIASADIIAGLDDHLNKLSPHELEQEADRILAEAESQENIEEFEALQNADYDDNREDVWEAAQLKIREAAQLKKMSREEYAAYQIQSGLNQDVFTHNRRMARIANERAATLDPDYRDDDHISDYEDGSSVRTIK